MSNTSLVRRVASRAVTLLGLVQHLFRRRRFFFFPLILVLLLASILLVLSQGLSYVVPFVYTLF